ncbi:TPA: PTS sugar transporter subunit IIB [Streptococcus suis]|nr:PTS sugar transporter subunit IIB [Streptococcus suis]HEM5963680.1 PTS sugar transporter subunit IIB [Streptococcus suis]HEM5991363.1 PTS sugar transporter subunit IIB [Streptococcus suis]HEM6196972.1 PTS sugar transporter subunit IIB [Streptococcus suis]HEP1779656.1 PTS sugar transporter subunit IIB [Streptococcus suis]
MLNITLVCAGGISTSMLVTRMQEAAKAKGVEADIRAMAESAFEKYDGKTDVLLLGPQIGFLEDDFKKTYEPQGIKVSVINIADYGMMNGAKVLDSVLEMI